MLNNRRCVVILLIILMTSVFLSCGIGVPYTIEATISYNQTSEDEDPKIGTINISTDEIDTDAKITLGPSLVLVYGISKDYFADPDQTLGYAANLSTVNSSWNTAKLPVVTTDASKKLFEKTIDGVSIDFYLFMPMTGTSLTDFNYHYNLGNSPFYSVSRIESPSSSTDKLTLTIPSVSGTCPTIDLNGTYSTSWRVNPNLKLLESNTGTNLYFYIFAAITSANSSTNYTTELKYLTSFTYTISK